LLQTTRHQEDPHALLLKRKLIEYLGASMRALDALHARADLLMKAIAGESLHVMVLLLSAGQILLKGSAASVAQQQPCIALAVRTGFALLV
jgi:hypothetical protein